MKIQLRGNLTLDEAVAGFHQAIEELREVGVKRISSTVLYANLTDDEGNIVRPLDHGRTVQQVVIVEPYRSAAEKHGL